jgi:glyoxylase-like metal-dependent hydrolase (beta-lactamase superfamily II)
MTHLWMYRVEEGLGNACALLFPDESGAVIDWGTEREEPLEHLMQLLLRAKEPRLRAVVATHPHSDHVLGLERLLVRAIECGIQIDRFVFPTSIDGPGRGHLRRARERAYRLRIPTSTVAVSTLPESAPAPVLALGHIPGLPDLSWKMRVIAPYDTNIGRNETRAEVQGITPDNPTSLVIQFAYVRKGEALDRGRAILPGDATPATLNWARRRAEEFPDLSLVNDALVIPHHGSRHNWVPWFKDTIKGFALISAPSGREKHPSPQVLKQLVHTCGTGESSRLFCASYAGACHTAYGTKATRQQGVPRRMDPCFQDVAVSLSPDAPPRTVSHDPQGPARRQFGHCG